MFKNKSIYALNKKDTDAIVFVDAKGTIERLTRDAFDSDEEFLKWKEWSDNDYHVSEKKDHVYANHTLSLQGFSDEAVAVQSPEAAMLSRLTEAEYIQNHADLVELVKAVLTEKQYRRLWMHYVDGMSEREIAALEQVGQPRISRSISTGKNAAEKIFYNFSEIGDKTAL